LKTVDSVDGISRQLDNQKILHHEGHEVTKKNYVVHKLCQHGF